MAQGEEFERLARLRPLLAGDGPGIDVGVGDDAAVVRIGGSRVVLCADAIVEGVHFTLELSRPKDVGWKAIAVNASDLAAMGATPVASLVVLQRSASTSEDTIDSLYDGLADAAQRYGLPIVGGDTVDGPNLSLTVTAVGEAGDRIVRRDGARPGDLIGLVGHLGAAAAALHAHRRGDPVPGVLLAAHRRPTALDRVGPALARAGASAMIDVSDGLGADAGHIARASGVQVSLDGEAVFLSVHPVVTEVVTGEEAVRLVVGGGEDFALLAAVPADRWEAAVAAVAATGQGVLRMVGMVTQGEGVQMTAPDGQSLDVTTWGHTHG